MKGRELVAAGVVLAAVLVFFVGCGSPTGPSDDDELELGSNVEVREIDPEIFGMKAVSYSGYRRGQSPREQEYPSKEQMKEDLELLEEEGFGLIRVFDSRTHGERTLEVIDENDLDLKVQLGAYVEESHEDNGDENIAELDRAIDLANQYDDIVVGVSVGNEVVVNWSFAPVPPDDMVDYVRYAREGVEQPVTVNDNWAPYAMGGNYDTQKVWREIDYASIHTYAYWDAGNNLWDWRQEEVPATDRARAMMDEAYAYARRNFDSVREALDEVEIDIPIVIGETGWQNRPTGRIDGSVIASAEHTAHEVNQAMYYDDMTEWAYGESGVDAGDGFERPMSVFYFAAFDEPWKQSDDNWGLWDVDREEKFALSRENYDIPDDAVYYETLPEATVITDDTFVVYRDASLEDNEATVGHEWQAWEDGATAKISTGTDDAPEGDEYAIVTPTPESWGWGMTLAAEDPVDLSAFEDSGSLEYRIKTDYPGSIEVGFFTGSASEGTGVDAYLVLDPQDNDYGYDNNDEWQKVSIPIEDIVPHAAPAYGQPSSAELDMGYIPTTFVIADRYAETGTSDDPDNEIALDDIRWEK